MVARAAPAPRLQNIQEFLSIPIHTARVTDAFWPSDAGRPTSEEVPAHADSSLNPHPSSLPDFILIQDVHRHPQVQSRIAYLIINAYNRWGVRKVFMEGAFTPLDVTVFHRVPMKTQELLVERLVKDGDLSGPELAAVLIMEREWTNPPVSPFQLFGMEEPKLYRQNILAYESVLAARDRALENLVSIRRLQTAMRVPPNNPLAQELDRIVTLLHLKLTPAEYEAYLKGKSLAPSSPVLNPAVRAAEEFYRLVRLRSRVFLKEAMRKAPASTAPRILVVGGFHTAEMAALLRQERRSFVVLSPAVSSGSAEPIYEKRLQETAHVITEVLLPSSR